MTSEEVVIIGNSFSGLGTAIACAKHGYQVTVIAPNNHSSFIGGLQIAPNGLAALSSLGVEQEILNKAVRLLAVHIKAFDTAVSLTNIPLSSNNAPYVSIARQDLYEILLSKCLTNSLINFMDASVLAITSKNNHTRLALDTGEIITAPIIIGADGGDGKTRHFISPSARQKNSGYSIYRGIFPASKVPAGFSYPDVQLWLGNSCHLVSYPIQNSQAVNFVFAFSERAFESHSIDAIFCNHPVLSMLGDYSQNWHLTPIKQFDSLSNWRRGGITLIGDAAHPMPPHLAQGAGQSFMDVASIENGLDTGLTLSNAISNMITTRMPEAHSVAKKSQLSGNIFRINSPIADLRNQLISMAGQKVISDFLQDLWLTA